MKVVALVAFLLLALALVAPQELPPRPDQDLAAVSELAANPDPNPVTLEAHGEGSNTLSAQISAPVTCTDPAARTAQCIGKCSIDEGSADYGICASSLLSATWHRPIAK